MARKKSLERKIPDAFYKNQEFFYGESYECPVCKKSFIFTTEHQYIIAGSFTCSWKCFMERAKQFHKLDTSRTTRAKGSLPAIQEKLPQANTDKIEKIEELW